MNGMQRLVIVISIMVCFGAVILTAAETYHIRVPFDDRSELETLTKLINIDSAEESEISAEVTAAEMQALQEAGFKWNTITTSPMATAATMCADDWVEDTSRSWNCYPTYQQYVAFLELIAHQYASICRLEVIGETTNEVRPHRLLALRISDHPGIEEDEPEVFLTSTMHGDETTGFVLLLQLINDLVEGYTADAEMTRIINEIDLVINPLANPDGTYAFSDDTVAGAIRFYTAANGANAQVNPNRNFPDPQAGQHPDGHPWWTETLAMMDFAELNNFVLSANFHGGAEVINYPWDTWSRRHADDQWLYTISRNWADAAQQDSPGGYMTQLDNGVTNGYDWYPVFGGRQDYMTYFHGSRELTVEISNTKLVAADELEAHWTYNRRAIYGFVNEALRGIRGLITTPDGQPIAADIEIIGHDIEADRSRIHNDPEVGDYHRLLLPGTYDLRFTAPGFETEDIGGIAVIDGEATRIDVVLQEKLPWRRGGRRVR